MNGLKVLVLKVGLVVGRAEKQVSVQLLTHQQPKESNRIHLTS
jgi:hypothetical protein